MMYGKPSENKQRLETLLKAIQDLAKSGVNVDDPSVAKVDQLGEQTTDLIFGAGSREHQQWVRLRLSTPELPAGLDVTEAEALANDLYQQALTGAAGLVGDWL